ncbi:MAG TPA: thioredoxin family protein [Pyrinomonadaceae bacterium]|jgi:peroxiredoxin|nr:thioredoxin family protein [Pyrinomonadaceae bacterium]
MKKLSTLALIILAASLALATPPAPTPDEKASTTAAIGSVVADFTLPDAGGREHSLSLLKGPKGTVIIFVATKCPVSNAYNERMQKLAQDYRAKGINVVGINSNSTEPAAEIKAHAAEKGLTFTILKDEGNRIADRLGAQVTPEAYLLDASGKLVYRGRIDNSRNGDSITSTELRDAVEAVLAGKAVEKAEVRAFGCSIKRVS